MESCLLYTLEEQQLVKSPRFVHLVAYLSFHGDKIAELPTNTHTHTLIR